MSTADNNEQLNRFHCVQQKFLSGINVASIWVWKMLLLPLQYRVAPLCAEIMKHIQ